MTHVTDRKLGRCGGTTRSTRGFTFLEILVVVALTGVLASVAVMITPGVLRAVKGEGTTGQAKAFLSRTRELAVSKRRNIEVRFVEPDRLVAEEMLIPGVPEEDMPEPRYTAEIRFEGGLEYRMFTEIDEDTPDLFGMASPIHLGGDTPVMFTSEGSFTDVNGDPINATISFGARGQPTTANAITIAGATAAIHQWRWNGDAWTDY
jgi:prepilin-type N-terminal cleavage/methylation domain-containing protein